MNGFDVVMLSRIQFGLTVAFHYIFPPLSIGLGLIMVIMEGMYMKSRNPIYERMTKFWTRIFGVNFAMGVATGIVMEFQFGTNWAAYSRYVGDVFGSALAAEGIFAFFLESGFLAILVFGWDRVSSRMHFLSTVMVAIGATFSSVWIIIANSWQQTPAGYHLVTEGGVVRAEITDFWALVFNPSSMQRLGHTLLGAYILAAFFVMSISAYYILRHRHLEVARKSFAIALTVGLIASLITPISGHFQAATVARTQPAKLAAYEGVFTTGTTGTPYHLFGILNEQEGRVDYAISIPGLLSYMTHGDANKPVTGLDQFKPEDRPPLALPFYSYHIMIALGIFFIALTLYGGILYRQRRLFDKRWLMWTFVVAVIGPYLANQLGWMAAEVGRQPWIVYGLLRTSDAVSKVVPGGQVLTSIIMFSLIYLMLFAIWVYVLHNKIVHGPDEPALLPAFAGGSDNLIEAAARLANPAGYSMTQARSESSDPETKVPAEPSEIPTEERVES
jgi:cytochrome d ubiquinol oxidase subunit I